MDMIAIYAASKSWTLRPNIVLVEGTFDERLFQRADDLSKQAGRILLGEEICIVAAGRRDSGGTYGVARELITLRSMVPLVLDRDGRPTYRVLGLVDNDDAGRRIIRDLLRMDRAALEFRDIVALRPVTPAFVLPDPPGRREEYELANLPYRNMDWEIEDTLSERLLAMFDQKHPGLITGRSAAGDKIHRDLTASGKIELHRLAQREATLEDLTGIIRAVRMIRSMLGLVIAPS